MGRTNTEHQTWEETYTNTLTVDKENKQQRNQNISLHTERERERERERVATYPVNFMALFESFSKLLHSLVGSSRLSLEPHALHLIQTLHCRHPFLRHNATPSDHMHRRFCRLLRKLQLYLCMLKTRTSINCMAKTTWEHKTKQHGG